MKLNEEILKQFLVKAKINTYAGDGNLSAPSRPDSKDLHYKEGDFLYIDSYFGSSDFIGQEVVYEKQKPIWGMNYYGKMLTDEIPSGFIKFLKSALKEVSVENPFRGPELFQQDEFTYKCSVKGGLSEFKGVEIIYLDNIEIYRLFFHGGYIKK
jgi:hypothetical protein